MTDANRSTPDVPPASRPAESDSPLGLQPPQRHLSRAVIVLAAVIAVLAVSLAFAPVRTLAAQLLSVFRVQKIATISISSADLDKMGQALEKGDSHVSLKDLGDVWVDGKPSFGSDEPTPTTLAKAQAAVDFPITVPVGVQGTQTVLLQPGSTVKFKLNIAKVNELLHYYGAEKLFSSSLDGKTFEVKMPPTVFMSYGKDSLGFSAGSSDMMSDVAPSVAPDPMTQDVFIVQTRGPELVVPEGVNPLEIRDVLLNLPFIPDSIRSQLSGVADWQHTLIIPNLGGSTRDITVGGNPGVVITTPRDPDEPPAPDEAKPPVAIMWHQDGVLRAVATKSETASLKIAESMAR